MILPDEPNIRSALNTGYPLQYHSKHSITCSKCDFTAPDDGEDEFYLWDGEPICGECIDKRLDAMSRCELAELLGAERIA